MVKVLARAQITADNRVADAYREAEETLYQARREADEIVARARRAAQEIARSAKNAVPSDEGNDIFPNPERTTSRPPDDGKPARG